MTAVLTVYIMAGKAVRVIMFSSESRIEGHLFADRVEVRVELFFPSRHCSCGTSTEARCSLIINLASFSLVYEKFSKLA